MRANVHVLATLVGLTILVGGCCEKEKQLNTQLTQENETLADQLQQANEQISSQEADLVVARNKLSEAMNKITGLGTELDEARKQPRLPKGWQARKGGMVMKSLPNKVLFAAGKADLKREAPANLQRIVSEVNLNFPGRDVYVIGHTDSDPIRQSKWRDNLELSLHRAASVARFLIKRGLNPKRVIVSGCGEYRPIASNLTTTGKADNRRVEFWVLNPTD